MNIYVEYWVYEKIEIMLEGQVRKKVVLHNFEEPHGGRLAVVVTDEQFQQIQIGDCFYLTLEKAVSYDTSQFLQDKDSA